MCTSIVHVHNGDGLWEDAVLFVFVSNCTTLTELSTPPLMDPRGTGVEREGGREGELHRVNGVLEWQ